MSNNVIARGKWAEVVKNARANEGTLVVEIHYSRKHPKYQKIQRFKTRLQVQHDSKAPVECGTQVYIKQCRPISKTKRWTVVEVA